MRGIYTITADPERPEVFLVVGAAGDSWWVGRTEAADVEGERMAVQRLDDRVLVADDRTGRVSASGSFVTRNVCRPPAAVARLPELSHYALEGPGLSRTEFHLGTGPTGSLGFILTPDGRRLARIAVDGDGDGSMEVTVDVDWRPVLAAVHLSVFSPPQTGVLRRLRRRLTR